MLQRDLIKDVKIRLATVKGQVEGIIKMLEDDKDPEQIRLQFKAAGKALEHAELLLLEETFRKSLALKIAETLNSCPGDCGQEELIERIRREFPGLTHDELTDKMKEIKAVSEQVKKRRDQE